MTADIDAVARDALAAFDDCRPIEPFTSRFPGFDTTQAYGAAAALRRLRQARGEIPAGRKIGFTNRGIWPQYNIDRPIWGDMYAHTIYPLDPGTPFALAPFCEPLIEPEIVLRLSQAPERGMDEAALLECVDWVAHGFEIVHSIFPGWRFRVADTIAGFGMHGALLYGPPLTLTPENRTPLAARLASCTVTLSRDDNAVDSGSGANVLGGPLSALRHLNDMLAADPYNPPLAAGEIITTGTLTGAFPVKLGEHWSARISGIPLPGLSIRFG